jgi:hypothetical protein
VDGAAGRGRALRETQEKLMGFDLYICDETGSDKKAQDACMKALNAFTDAVDRIKSENADVPSLDPRDFTRLAYGSQRATGLYFRADVATWDALVAEMRKQKMIAEDAMSDEKVNSNAGHHPG